MKKNNFELVFLGTGSSIEEGAYDKFSSVFYKLQMEGFRGKSLLKKLKVIFQVILNIFRVIKILKIIFVQYFYIYNYFFGFTAYPFYLNVLIDF